METIYRAAGILLDLPDPRQVAAEILGYKLSELSESQLDEVLQFIEFIQGRDERGRKKQARYIHDREGAAPPEAVKE